MPCDEISPILAAVADGDARLGRSDRRHVEQCLRCQAELAQYRKLLRAMQALRSGRVPAPAGAVADVLARLEVAGEQGAVRAALTGRKVAYLGGIAAATAAGAGAAIVFATRGRNPLAS